MASIERMVTNPRADSGYLMDLVEMAIGALAVGSALGAGLWALRNSAQTAEEVTEEGVSGFAFGGNL